MKKSEAEAIIHEYLIRNSVHEISPKEILDLVEVKVGMRPPTYEKKIKGFSVPYFEWEQEDEA